MKTLVVLVSLSFSVICAHAQGPRALPVFFERLEKPSGGAMFLARAGGETLFLSPGRAAIRIRARGVEGTFAMDFVGANPRPEIDVEEPLPGISNYFMGSDPRKWRTNVPQYGQVRYRGIYPGVDLLFYGDQGRLEYDWIVAADADPGVIRMRFDGPAEIDAGGDLVLRAGGMELRHRAPVIYEELEGRRRELKGHYTRAGKGEFGFEIAGRRRGAALRIDPILAYATYLGGSGVDTAADIALDSAGNIYVTGSTTSIDFPSAGPLVNPKPNVTYIFVVKLNSAETAVQYATYLGGSAGGQGTSVAVGSDGNAYVTGLFNSTDFPFTAGAYRHPNAASGVFAAELSAAAGNLVYAASVCECGRIPSIAVDSAGNAYIADEVFRYQSTGPVTSPDAFQSAERGGNLFIAKLNAPGTQLRATFLGGSSQEQMSGGLGVSDYRDPHGKLLAVNNANQVIIAGATQSRDFPVTPGAYQTAPGGAANVPDAFVAALDSDLRSLVWSTLLGGPNRDFVLALALDATGNVYVAGTRDISNTSQSLIFDYHGFSYVAKLTPTGTALAYLTNYAEWSCEIRGGFFTSDGCDARNQIPRSVAADAAGNAYVSGWTNSGTAATFLSKLNTLGTTVFSTTLAGGTSGYDALDANNNIVVAGSTTSTSFPVTADALQVNNAGGSDNFVARFTGDGPVCAVSLGAAGQFVAAAGGDVTIQVLAAPACGWTAGTNTSWIHVVSGASGSGNGSVVIHADSVAAGSRTGTVIIANRIFTVTEGCSYTITPGSTTVPGGGGQGSLSVAALSGCAWSASSADPWISFGNGSTSLVFNAAANVTGAQRSGTITIGGQAVTVTQGANNALQIPALVSLSPFQGTGPNATLTLVYSHPSGWAAIRSAEFIINPRWEANERKGGCYIKYAPATGLFTLIGDDGNSIAGSIAPGTMGAISNSQCILHGANSSVTGSGATLTMVVALSFQPTFTGQRHIWMQAVDHNNLSTNWLVYGVWFPAQTTVGASPWYRIYDPFFGNYLYSFDKHEYDTLGTQGFVLQGISGLVMDGPATVGGVSSMAWYRVYVNATNSHVWTSDRNEFLTLINSQQAYVGEGVAAFVMPYINAAGQVSPQVTNTIPFYRAAFQGKNLHFWTPDADEFFGTNGKHLPAGYVGEGIASYIFPASGAQFTSAVQEDDGAPAVVSAGNGAIAPGQAVSIYGRHLGGTVLLNGSPATVIAARDNELRVVAPRDLAGVSEVTVEVEHRGRRSRQLKLEVVPANPAIFGSNPYGRGYAQARNEDGTMNDAQHAAARGAVVTLYTTGAGVSGLPVGVRVGGRPAEILSMQESGTRAGAVEVRIRVPELVEPADFQPVVLQVGNLFSQPGVGLAVR